MSHENTIESSDLWAVAYALASDVKLVRATPGPWVTFVLDNSSGRAAAALNEWYRETAVVHAREYAAQYRTVRRLAWTA